MNFIHKIAFDIQIFSIYWQILQIAVGFSYNPDGYNRIGWCQMVTILDNSQKTQNSIVKTFDSSNWPEENNIWNALLHNTACNNHVFLF